MRREVRATANRLANFDDANLRRSARAAVAAGARVRRALEMLGRRGPGPPGRGRAAAGWSTGRPRWRSWAQLADPPMTKDAVAGRIRRLLAMADKRAAELGVPDTESAVTADMLDGHLIFGPDSRANGFWTGPQSAAADRRIRGSFGAAWRAIGFTTRVVGFAGTSSGSGCWGLFLREGIGGQGACVPPVNPPRGPALGMAYG